MLLRSEDIGAVQGIHRSGQRMDNPHGEEMYRVEKRSICSVYTDVRICTNAQNYSIVRKEIEPSI